jgi:putative transposase
MCDSLFCRRRFRTLNIVDDFNREALAIEIDVGLSADRVKRVLDRVVALRGYPSKLRMDNGPEFISTTLADWAEEHAVNLEFIQPGKPTQNSYVKRFNRTYRDEVLNMYVFKTLSEARAITEEWMDQYNEERPHDALGDLTPFEYRVAHQQREYSTLYCP